MKKFYMLLLLLVGPIAGAQIINFPDPAFKAKLIASGPLSDIAWTGVHGINGVRIKIDANNDGEIQQSEAAAVTSLSISSSNISNLDGIGGDPIIGTTTKAAVEMLMNDPETKCIVMIGEIGGQLEADAAKWIKADGNRKPVIGFIAGETAPKGRTMGHAGAIVGGSDDTAEAKKRIMRENGIHVVDSPAEIGKKVKEVMG